MKASSEQVNAKKFGEGECEERKVFMKGCLSAKPEQTECGKATQQNKMKVCNNGAGEKSFTGEERKKFMSDCLSA